MAGALTPESIPSPSLPFSGAFGSLLGDNANAFHQRTHFRGVNGLSKAFDGRKWLPCNDLRDVLVFEKNREA